MKIHYLLHKKKESIMIYRTSLTMTLFTLILLSLSITFLVSSSPQVSFAQLSPSPEMPLTQESPSQFAELESARQQYLLAWNDTAFSSQFDVFVAEGTVSLYGVYREHIPANVFRPGETIVLYVEPVGFAHQPIADTTNQDGGNGTATTRNLYLIDMTADIIISDSTGTELQTIEDLPIANLISHRPTTEVGMTLTLSQEQPFPVGDYIITYIINDEVSGQRFEIDKMISIDADAVTGALPLPDIGSDNTMQQPEPQQLEEGSQALE
jgi:hypothetical protein